MLTPPGEYEQLVASEYGITNFVPGSLEIDYVNTAGPTTIRFQISAQADSARLIALFNQAVNDMLGQSTS